MKKIEKNVGIIVSTLEWIDYVLMAALIVILFMQVVLRYIFNVGLVWSEELSKILFVWIVFISISIQVYSNKYLEFSFLQSKIRKHRVLIYIFTRICILVFFIIIGYFSVIYTIVSGNQMSYALNISTSWFYVIMPISSALSVFFLIVKTISDLANGRITA